MAKLRIPVKLETLLVLDMTQKHRSRFRSCSTIRFQSRVWRKILKLCKINNWVYSLLCRTGWGWKCYWLAQWSRKQDNQIDQRCCNLRISATRYTGKLSSSNNSPAVFIKWTINRPKLMTVPLVDVVTVGAASGRNAAEAKCVYQASSVRGWEEQLARAVGWRSRSKTKSGETYFNTDNTGISAIARSVVPSLRVLSVIPEVSDL